MPTRLQSLTHSTMVVNLAVEHNPYCAIFVADGLMSGRQIDDAQATHTNADAALNVNSVIVGAAMDYGSAHSPQSFGIHARVATKLHYAGNSTHSGFL
jgi:hypothetical protein